MQDCRGEDGFDGMTDGMAKVDEVAETRFALVDRDDVRFDTNRGGDDMEE